MTHASGTRRVSYDAAPMRKSLMIAALLGALSLGTIASPAAARSTYLSERSAVHALRVNLARGYRIGHVHTSCTRRSRSKLACRWSGRRADGTYRGRAVIGRAGGSTLVQLSDVRRAG
jgi:hypothetical protein